MENLVILSVVLIIPIMIFFKLLVWVLSLRRVVPTNQVHIVQSARKTISYGKDTADNQGNKYYAFPSWIPFLGVSVIVLPVSVFDLSLTSYEAYDKERLPFLVDVTAFFRISDSNTAASRVETFEELNDQLKNIIQGAVRSILANEQLEIIMGERAIYGSKFTLAVKDQLSEWGVETVKNIELMDIRDSKDSQVIANIMAKKQSEIEMESRRTVAENKKTARNAEINANKEVLLKEEDANQMVGMKKAQVTQEVGIASQKAEQAIKEEEKLTKEKEMAILQVSEIQKAEIQRKSSIVTAEQNKEIIRLNAEATKKEIELKAEAKKTQIELEATANLSAKLKEAEGINAEGTAKANVEKQLALAPVSAQIELAKEIGSNKEYQEYLITIEKVKANQEIGIEQAKNLGHAQIKVIANSGDVTTGITKAMDLFSTKGGTALAGAFEALNQTDAGKKIVDKFTGNQA